jgi:hypothetical protein
MCGVAARTFTPMSKQVRWLMAESERWVRERIVSPEQAERIRALYPEAPTAPWGMIVFSGLGAVIVRRDASCWRA